MRGVDGLLTFNTSVKSEVEVERLLDVVMPILTAFTEAAMREAKYRMLDDNTFWGEIPPCPGVWANEETLEKCRDILREVLEEWLILKLRDRDPLPPIAGIDLNTVVAEA